MDQASLSSTSLPVARMGGGGGTIGGSTSSTSSSSTHSLFHKRWRILVLFALAGMGSLICYNEMLRIYTYTSAATVWIDEAVELVDVAHQIEESLVHQPHQDDIDGADADDTKDESIDDDAAIVDGFDEKTTLTSWTNDESTDGSTVSTLSGAAQDTSEFLDAIEDEEATNMDEVDDTHEDSAVIPVAKESMTRDEATFSFQSKSKTQPVVSNNIVERSVQHVEPPSNIRAAVCFKTLFGQIDLGIVIQWVAYNILLGFDRIFMFYRPEVTQLPRWSELSRLPYVTLTKQTKGSRDNYYDQAGTEVRCLRDKRLAATYDWVLTADIDEYLWFPQRVGVKEFLRRYSNATYLSFGKQMHSLSNRVDKAYFNYKIDVSDSSTFAVSHYPFYMKYFCRQKGRKNHPICPTWVGRAKVMVRPRHHKTILVHGTKGHDKLDNRTAIHFHPDAAHFMEWPEIFARHNVTRRAPQRFTIRSQDEVSIHDVHTGFTRIGGDGGKFLVWDGTWQVEYDAHLKDWFDFVIGRGSATATADPTKDLDDTHE